MTRLTNFQLIQKMQDLIVNDEDLHLAASDYAHNMLANALGENVPDMINEDHALYNEHVQGLYYGLINEFMVTIVGRAISGFNDGIIRADPPEVRD